MLPWNHASRFFNAIDKSTTIPGSTIWHGWLFAKSLGLIFSIIFASDKVGGSAGFLLNIFKNNL